MFKRLFYILKQRLYVLNNKNRTCSGKIYMFHNVSDDDDIYSISKENFESFINEILKTKKIVDFETLTSECSDKNVVITFDDVYESVYKNAYPILKEKNVPYYLFLCNELLNTEKYIKTEQAKEMLNDSKCVVGSHNYRHELSRFADREVIKNRMIESKNELEELFGTNVNSFAFPYGSMYAVSEENIEDAKTLFDYVCMTYPLFYSKEDGSILPRINMNNNCLKEIQ